MKSFITLLFILTLFVVGGVPVAYAQVDVQCPHIQQLQSRPNRRGIDDSISVREQLIKLCLKELKKDYEELVERTEEISKLSGELKDSFAETNELSKEDYKKLERVQSLLKKVRKELKAKGKIDDEDKDSLPKSVLEAVNQLQEESTELLVQIKKTTRHTVSLAAVKSSQAVMRIVRFLRLKN